MRSIFLISVATASLLAGQALAGVATHRAHGPIHQIVDFSQTAGSQTSGNNDFIDLPGSSFNLIIPSGADQLVMARFTTKAGIRGPDVTETCSVKIMAGNAEMTPNSGNDYAIVTELIANQWNWVGGVLDRSIVLHPGTYVIKVQFATIDMQNTCELDDWHLNVMTADNGAMPGTVPEHDLHVRSRP